MGSGAKRPGVYCTVPVSPSSMQTAAAPSGCSLASASLLLPPSLLPPAPSLLPRRLTIHVCLLSSYFCSLLLRLRCAVLWVRRPLAMTESLWVATSFALMLPLCRRAMLPVAADLLPPGSPLARLSNSIAMSSGATAAFVTVWDELSFPFSAVPELLLLLPFVSLEAEWPLSGCCCGGSLHRRLMMSSIRSRLGSCCGVGVLALVRPDMKPAIRPRDCCLTGNVAAVPTRI